MCAPMPLLPCVCRYVRTDLVFPLKFSVKDRHYPYDVFSVSGTSLLPTPLPSLSPPLPELILKRPGELVPLDEMYKLKQQKQCIKNAVSVFICIIIMAMGEVPVCVGCSGGVMVWWSGVGG